MGEARLSSAERAKAERINSRLAHRVLLHEVVELEVEVVAEAEIVVLGRVSEDDPARRREISAEGEVEQSQQLTGAACRVGTPRRTERRSPANPLRIRILLTSTVVGESL